MTYFISCWLCCQCNVTAPPPCPYPASKRRNLSSESSNNAPIAWSNGYCASPRREHCHLSRNIRNTIRHFETLIIYITPHDQIGGTTFSNYFQGMLFQLYANAIYKLRERDWSPLSDGIICISIQATEHYELWMQSWVTDVSKLLICVCEISTNKNTCYSTSFLNHWKGRLADLEKYYTIHW